jgi:iron complex transport system permease protein
MENKIYIKFLNKNIFLSIIISLFIICIGVSIGSTNVNLIDTISILLNKILNIKLSEAIDVKDISIIWKLRLPRVLLAFMVGGCLAVSGAVVQSVLKNQLASPYTLGVSSGAAFGAGLIIVSGVSIPYLGVFTLPIVGFICGLITVYTVLMFSSKVDKNMSNNTIILSGMVFSLFVNSLLTILSAIFTDDLKTITLWQMGSFAMKGWSYVLVIIPFFIVGFIGVLFFTKEMDILTFGEEQAKSVGVDTSKVKKKLFIFSTILAAGAISISGTIGFIDLIAPHIVRKIFGSKHKVVICMSFVFGGSIMVITDLIARTIMSPIELPVGAVTAILGAPFFGYVYFKKTR